MNQYGAVALSYLPRVALYEEEGGGGGEAELVSRGHGAGEACQPSRWPRGGSTTVSSPVRPFTSTVP